MLIMDLQSIHEFLKKYAAESHTQQEHQAFIDWLNSARVEQIQGVLDKYPHIAEASAGNTQNSYPYLVEKIETRLDEIDGHSVRSPAKTIPLWSSFKKLASVAAVLILLAGLGLFLWLNKTGDFPGSLAIQDKVGTKKIEFRPGTDKAILTLADGSQIILDSMQNGSVATQSGINIRRDISGRVVFDASAVTDNNIEPGINTITTPRGGQYQVVLPDGTKVWLNAASSLKFPTFFPGNERNVQLTGEAYFEVAKDRHKPFKVLSPGQTVEVLGTHFNINAYPDEAAINTTLLEGSVSIQPTVGSRQPAVLKPGQRAQIVESGQMQIVNNANINEAVAWKNGYFVFAHESIQNIMRQLSRWYDADIVYQGKITIESFTGTISRFENISEVLDMLQLTGAVHFRIESKSGDIQRSGRRIIVMP